MRQYIILVALLVVVGCEKDKQAIPPPGPHFTVSPVPVEMLARISELGENGKILPVSHTYWTTCDDGFVILPSGNPCHLGQFPIMAPTSGKVLLIDHNFDGEVSVEGPPGLLWTFAHVTPTSSLERGSAVAAGEQIATMTYDYSFDFGVINYGVDHDYIADERYPGPGQHGQHPIELYTEPLRTELMGKLVSGQLGKLNYDVAGTVSGAWFREDAPSGADVFNLGNGEYLIWFGRLAEHPATRIMNVGEQWPGMPVPVFTYVVDDADPDWTDITPADGAVQLKLWEVSLAGEPDGVRSLGSILVELINDETMQIQWFDGHGPVAGFTPLSRIYKR
jgi:hypothetical protein